MRELRNDRPLAFLDLETTGTSPSRDRIVEISVLRLDPGQGEPEVRTRRVNPERPIPPEATAIHGIRDEDLRTAPRFRQIARSLAAFLEGCDLAGYNLLRFDLPLLLEEFGRAGVPFSLAGRRLLDVHRLFCKLEPRDLTAAVRRYLGEEHEGAHGAEADARATFRVLEAMLRHHPALPRDLPSLATFAHPEVADRVDPEGKLRRAGGRIVLSFGRHAGTPLAELARTDPDYLRWILAGDFSATVKAEVRRALAAAAQG